jgi:hypothetical protein
MSCRNAWQLSLLVVVWVAAETIALPGCGSSSSPPNVADASLDGSISAGGPSAQDAGEVTSFCTGPATSAVIDDMSGSDISFAPPPCGTKGGWLTDILAPNTVTTPTGDTTVLSRCGSLCQSLYSPLPPGLPGTMAMVDGGALDTAADFDGGTPGAQAMCFAGQTPAGQYTGTGLVLGFAFSGPVPAGGPAWVIGSASGVTSVPAPALIDASQYTGIQFWLWVSPGTVADVNSGLAVQLVDKNQLLGGGMCDPNASGGKSCGATSAAVASSPAGVSQTAGPLYSSDGTKLAAFVGGWQLVLAPWSSFRSNPYWGGDNAKAVDPKALAALEFYVMQSALNGPALSFDFCVYQLSFYK